MKLSRRQLLQAGWGAGMASWLPAPVLATEPPRVRHVVLGWLGQAPVAQWARSESGWMVLEGVRAWSARQLFQLRASPAPYLPGVLDLIGLGRSSQPLGAVSSRWLGPEHDALWEHHPLDGRALALGAHPVRSAEALAPVYEPPSSVLRPRVRALRREVRGECTPFSRVAPRSLWLLQNDLAAAVALEADGVSRWELSLFLRRLAGPTCVVLGSASGPLVVCGTGRRRLSGCASLEQVGQNLLRLAAPTELVEALDAGRGGEGWLSRDCRGRPVWAPAARSSLSSTG